MDKKKRMTIQFILAVAMAIFGCVLLTIACFLPPTGVIDSSVLVAVGEVLTFVGSVFGLDYSYKIKIAKFKKDNDINDEE